MAFFWQAVLVLMFLEAVTFALVIGEIGFANTFLAWIFSALIGGFLVKRQGMLTLTRARAAFEKGVTPVDELYESLCLLSAGALFILPGFISDIFAFFLLVPMLRGTIREKGTKIFGLKEGGFKTRDDGVIEGDFVRVEEEREQLPKN